MKIGWIGTGVMGTPMAGRLLSAGHEVLVCDLSRDRARPLLDQGAVWKPDVAAVAQSARVIFTMVGYPSDVEQIYFAEGGILAHAEAGTIAIDMSTSSPRLAQRLAATGAKTQVQILDAPASGSDIGARGGTLSIMVGGNREAFEQVEPLLLQLGQTVVLQGPAGSGQHTKMVNQILIAGTMIGVCEALLYARRSCLDPRTVLESVGGGAAASWCLKNLFPRILDGNLEPGFYVEHFIKDMGIALDEAEAMKLALPGLALAKQLYQSVLACGGARKGIQALILAVEAMNGGTRG